MAKAKSKGNSRKRIPPPKSWYPWLLEAGQILLVDVLMRMRLQVAHYRKQHGKPAMLDEGHYTSPSLKVMLDMDHSCPISEIGPHPLLKSEEEIAATCSLQEIEEMLAAADERLRMWGEAMFDTPIATEVHERSRVVSALILERAGTMSKDNDDYFYENRERLKDSPDPRLRKLAGKGKTFSWDLYRAAEARRIGLSGERSFRREVNKGARGWPGVIDPRLYRDKKASPKVKK